MERCINRIIIAIGMAGLCMIVIGLVAGLTSSGTKGGGGEVEEGEVEDPIKLPEFLNSSLCPANYGPRPLLLVSLDGFRAEYLGRRLTPSIQEVADKGVQADYMMSSYPTVTFPNHYTIVTGLYPEAHGIIANRFYDPEFRQLFGLGTNESREGRWWGGEPIWNTVTSQGKKSATFFWPGSDADIQGKRPTYWKKYNGSIPYEERVLQVLEWLKLDKEHRPAFVSLYVDEPDHAGHEYGPDSDEVNEQLERVDKMIRMLMNGLKDANLVHCVNVIILSDHGMTEAGSKRVIDLMEYLPDLRKKAYYQRSVVSRINPKNKSEEVALDIVRKLSCGLFNELRVYLKEWLPKRLHFTKNPRIEDIVLDLNPGYTTQFNSTWALEGQHGYDNYFPDMNTIFIAYGPDFKPSLKIKPFQNIELYNLMCHLMGVQPAKNNGTTGSLDHVLRDPPPTPEVPKMPKPHVLRLPTSDREIKANWNVSGCDQTEYSEQPWMSALKMTEEQEKVSEVKHLPWGIPSAAESLSPNISLLYHPDHVTGFSSHHKMPLWTSFTLNSDDHDKVWQGPPMSQWISDVRLPAAVSPSCQLFQELNDVGFLKGYDMYTLFPTTVQVEKTGASSASHMVSNAIPVFTEFQVNWIDFTKVLPHWMESRGPMNFIMGPVFDTMDNPHAEHLTKKGISIPSDLFIILTHCMKPVTPLDLCHAHDLDTRSFILHQYRPVLLCYRSQTEYLTKFSATIKDVERVTHLTFFPNLPYLDRVNLTLMAHPDIWPRP